MPAPTIALSLALYVTLYLALMVAYVGVLKYMAEKTEQVLQDEAADRAATPAGAITASAMAAPAAQAGTGEPCMTLDEPSTRRCP